MKNAKINRRMFLKTLLATSAGVGLNYLCNASAMEQLQAVDTSIYLPAVLNNISMDGWHDIGVPEGWNWQLPFVIQQNGRNFRPKPPWTIEDYKITGKAYYVSKTGNDSNTGLDWDNSLRRLSTALSKSDVDMIYIAAGYYGRFDGGLLSNPIRNISVIGVGDVYLSQDLGLTNWTAVDNHYENSTGGRYVGLVTDASNLDSDGEYQLLTNNLNIATVDENPGSFYYDGTTIYVRTFDSREPDAQVHCYFTGQGPIDVNRDNYTIYCENINFEGGNRIAYIKCASDTGGTKAYFNHCTFKYAGPTQIGPDNGVHIAGSEAYFFNCGGSKTGIDLFHYNVANSLDGKGIEINCWSRDTGLPGRTDANGSSGHGNSSIVRIMGNYTGSYGPVINDIHNCQTWNLGCSVSNSLSVGGDATRFAIGTSSGLGNLKIWIDSCQALGNTSFDIANYGGATVYKRDFIGAGINHGTIIDY